MGSSESSVQHSAWPAPHGRFPAQGGKVGEAIRLHKCHAQRAQTISNIGFTSDIEIIRSTLAAEKAACSSDYFEETMGMDSLVRGYAYSLLGFMLVYLGSRV